MIQISNQHTRVDHEFEHVREREITAVVDSQQPLLHTQNRGRDNLAPLTEESGAFQVKFSPQQLVNKQLIESITNRSAEDDTHAYFTPKLNNNSTIQPSIQQNSAPQQNQFVVDGHLVTNQSQIAIREYLYEKEQLDYSTSLHLKNPDQSISELNLSLSFSRELNIERNLTMTVAEFKDPLILNLDHQASLFNSTEQRFDIDADGSKDKVLTLKEGVWYLAYDRNDNGIIDNGLELFGATTGNGFNELRAFDSNQDNFIDEQDVSFQKLQLWDCDKTLKSLSDKGVAAIILDPTNTPFTFTDNAGNPRAQLRQTSVFITDQQKLGTIHQIDIVV